MKRESRLNNYGLMCRNARQLCRNARLVQTTDRRPLEEVRLKLDDLEKYNYCPPFASGEQLFYQKLNINAALTIRAAGISSSATVPGFVT